MGGNPKALKGNTFGNVTSTEQMNDTRATSDNKLDILLSLK